MHLEVNFKSNMKQKISCNRLGLLEKLLDHPHGWALANMVFQREQDVKFDAQPHRQLVAIALNKAKSLGIQKRPYFKGMTSDEIRMWLNQHSLAEKHSPAGK